MKHVFVQALCFVILVDGVMDAHAGDTEIEQIKSILQSPHRDDSKWPWQEHAEDLKPMGDRAITLLASLLEDDKFGDEAAATMLEIDPDKAAPIIFESMPESDGNVQFHTFARFIPRLSQGEKLSFAPAMHDAAVRCLEARAGGNVAEQALIVIGLTENAADFPLLERYYDNKDSVDSWRCRIQNAAEAALARLGHQNYLKNIEAGLSVSVQPPLSEGYASSLEATINEAGFSQNPRFVPLLVKHLDDPPADTPPSDMAPPSPSTAARIALYEIATHASSGMDYTMISFQKLDNWWKENKQKFGK